jgi:hypothetical protein
MLGSGALFDAAQLFLFSMHITRNKIIAGVVVALVLVAGLVFWFVRRRQAPASPGR